MIYKIPNCLPTDEEVKEQYKNYKNLQIERDENNLTITYEEPCSVCNKYHKLGSKAQKQCNIIFVSEILKVFPEI